MCTPNRIKYNHLLKQDKYYFGGYFNLAYNNIKLILDSFAEEFSTKKVGSINGSLENFFPTGSKEITQLDFEYRADYLKRYFPIVGILKFQSFDKKRNSYIIPEFRNNLELIFSAINSLRNFYTHYYHAPIEINLLTKLYPLLDNLLLQVIELVLKSKKGDGKTKELLKDSLRGEVEILCKQKEVWLSDNNHKSDSESVYNAVLNDAFYHIRYKLKDEKQFKLSRYYQSQLDDIATSENGMSLSRSGVVFLLSAFLGKKEGEEFRGRIEGFKAKVIKSAEMEICREKNNLMFMATHCAYSWGAFTGYKKKLNTEYHKETLLIQIIDELSKVPDSVYNVLNEENKKEFLEDINEFVQEHDETKSLSEATVIHPVIRKRYEDKFNYFVIRFLDEFVSFPSLRFQIHLGNYIHDVKDKVIPGVIGESRREIREKIKVFGKLSELSNLKATNLNNQDNLSIGWELFPNPSYNFVGNNVPIYLNLNKVEKRYKKIIDGYKKERNKSEVRTKRGEDKTKVYEMMNALGITNNIALQNEPTAILSFNELPSLLYEILVKKTEPEEIEEVLLSKLKQKIDTLESFSFAERKDGSKAKYIPKTLQKATNSEIIDKNKLSNAIEKELDNTQKRKDIITASKTNGEYHLDKKQKGEMATWLADDLIRLMPKGCRVNWKGYHHRQLQASLTFYHNKERRDAIDLLSSVWDFEKDEGFIYKSELRNVF